MSEEQVINTLRLVMQRTGIPYTAMASAAGVSPTTARHVVESGRLPGRRLARQAIEQFVETNKAAQSRGELRFTP